MKILLIAAGGAVGTVLRFLIATSVSPTLGMPATLWINLSGSFTLGLVWGIGVQRGWHDSPLYLAAAVGILGGYTTFSTFSLDTLMLWSRSGPRTAVLYTLISAIGGILCTGLGMMLTSARP